ncbi:serine hydrolase domain-containing protein [Alterisphingorhabdus coralli]|uniref:Serine hydrolase n=1 Tax=Alterisphingorhabdus coralli TaxID=3071408 RepID=A0AA97FAK5_9SPHN|nr:serine hydrolase [Parasphingorhabdus sp. SCSIO 66989]WOE76077.1 serine hydrolase [Parasphingorhabdus sp. SCSIO 66989]
MRDIVRLIIAVIAILAIPATAQEQTEPSRTDRAYAAGYKAQFICSGLWNGGKSLEDIEADELTGIYDRIADIVPTLEPVINEQDHIVSVRFADDMPPRMARWDRMRGCISAPIGATEFGPYFMGQRRPDLDDRSWPRGDRGAQLPRIASYDAMDTIAASAFREGDHKGGEKRFGGKTSAVLIANSNGIIWEGYKPGQDKHTAQRTWSVAKSVAGTLVGYYVSDTSKTAPVPAWQMPGDPRAAISYDDLLRMASGLQSDTAGNRTDPIYMGGASVVQRTSAWPLLHPPGTRFRYANNDTLLAVLAAVEERRQMNAEVNKVSRGITQQYLFDPYDFFFKIGMTRSWAEHDWQGNYVLSSQMWTTARDLARLGTLYLNDGEWVYEDGIRKRLLPKGWRDYVSTPSGPQPDFELGYGATFWLMNTSEGIPKDTFAAIGNRGQFLVIIPSRDLIIVRRGYDTREDRFDIQEFTRELVAALP